MTNEINAYLNHESQIAVYHYHYMNVDRAKFIKGKNKLVPIAQDEIDQSVVMAFPLKHTLSGN